MAGQGGFPVRRGMAGAVLALTFTLTLGGCLTLNPELLEQAMNPIAVAARTDPATLESNASSGRSEDQYAWSLALLYGLNGVPRDTETALRWRGLATAQRGTTSTPVWVPGVEGNPGYLIFVSTPVYDLAPGTANLIDRCAVQLEVYGRRPQAPANVQNLCGGPEAWQRLRTLWLRSTVETDAGTR